MNWIAFITPRQADEFSREKSLTKHPYARISSIEEFPSTFNSDPESVGRIEIITDEQKKASHLYTTPTPRDKP